MDRIIRNLFIGDSQDARDVLVRGYNPNQITAVLNVAFDLNINVLHDYGVKYYHRGLIDGEGNTTEQFENAVATARDLLTSNNLVLIHCHAGVSRSVTVAATAIAQLGNLYLEQAIALIAAKRSVAYPNKELILLAREILK